MKSKTIILSSENQNGRGILTIFEEDELLKCKIRTYNISGINRFCKLGIYHKNEVFSANLLEKNGVYLSSLVGDFDIDKDFYTAIVDTSDNNKVILSGGTYAGFYYSNQSSVFSKIEKENPTTNLINEEEFEIINTYNNAGDTCVREEKIDQEKLCDENSERCKNCKYKEFFYNSNHQNPNPTANNQEKINSSPIKSNNINQAELNQDEKEAKIEPNLAKKSNVLSAIVPQFKYVFENYDSDETLNKLIPNGKFVKINENKEQYSIGAIYENEEMKYICYAVLKNYNSNPPEELGKHYQWLPLDNEDPLSEGYFIVFQDASDLKIVEL